MANTSEARGFVPQQNCSGINTKGTNYFVSTAYATAIYPGDLVVLSATTGGLIQCGSVTTTTDTNVIGIFAGCNYVDTNGRPTDGAWPGTTTNTKVVAYVYDDKDLTAVVQNAAALTAANIGDQATYVVGSPSTLFKRSAAVASATTETGPVRILGLAPIVGNDWGTNQKVIVNFVNRADAN
jgi:hypothetical protein